MLENTEGAIKNGKSRGSGNRVHKTMENKTKTQHNVLDTTMRKQTQIT